MRKTIGFGLATLLTTVSLAALAAAGDEKAASPSPAPAAAAAAPADAAPKPASKPLWSWQPVQEQFQPVVAHKEWVRKPLDAFVLSKIEAKGLTPSPDADRATFIRRATLDVWGVIPTPEEVAAFVNDTSPDAYEKLVDRLLASPRYGERQARLWLDLARYADSSGFQNDTTRPNLFRYRDYVINAFNEDKPYSRFIQEQIAGDEIAPDDQNVLVATGFLAGYPDNRTRAISFSANIRSPPTSSDTVGQAVLGTTVGCARCHNHKTDKFSQKDYYSLQAFFANTAFDEKAPAAKGEQEAQYLKAQAIYDEATKDIREKQKAIIDSVRDAALKYHKERYLTDSRESIFKPKDQWNALDRWVNHRLEARDRRRRSSPPSCATPPKTRRRPSTATRSSRSGRNTRSSPRSCANSRTSGRRAAPTPITTATELGHPDSPPTFIFFGGNHERPLDEVQPAFPEAMTSEKPDIKPTGDVVGPPHGARQLAREPEQSADGARLRQPHLEPVFRQGHRRHGQRLRQGGRQADQPGAARLSRLQLREGRLERQESAPRDSALRHLSPIFGSARGGRQGRSR